MKCFMYTFVSKCIFKTPSFFNHFLFIQVVQMIGWRGWNRVCVHADIGRVKDAPHPIRKDSLINVQSVIDDRQEHGFRVINGCQGLHVGGGPNAISVVLIAQEFGGQQQGGEE